MQGADKTSPQCLRQNISFLKELLREELRLLEFCRREGASVEDPSLRNLLLDLSLAKEQLCKEVEFSLVRYDANSKITMQINDLYR